MRFFIELVVTNLIKTPAVNRSSLCVPNQFTTDRKLVGIYTYFCIQIKTVFQL